MYRVAVGHLLGIRIEHLAGRDVLIVDPCIPKAWPGFSATLRRGETTWNIAVANPRGVNRGIARVTVDGANAPAHSVPLIDDGNVHEVRVTLLGG
jgi:cyclic beta-1,2-glucan synthetase